MKDFKYNYNNQTGMYRERIKIMQCSTTVDDIGQEIESYVDRGSYWSMVKTFSNREELRNGSEKFAIDKRFVIKYNKGLDDFVDSEQNTFEVIHKGITYKVKEAINDNDLNETITIRLLGHA